MSHTAAVPEDLKAVYDSCAPGEPHETGGVRAWYVRELIERIAALTQERDGLLKLLTNCRNGLELLLAEHAPEHPEDPWDTINELRETVRESTEGINAARAALAAGESK